MAGLSPLAPKSYPELPEIEGVRFAAGEAGIRYKDRTDVMLALFDKGTEVAGVFTKSKCPSAPVDWCRARLPGGRARALIVNSGNANAFTGKAGAQATRLTATIAAKATGAPQTEIFLASTGVIGEPLDATKFDGALQKLAAEARPGGLFEAARAIMTTDTYPKVATIGVEIGGVAVNLAGMAKGAGMIAPDMATMLAFVFTDAPIAAPALQAMLSKSVSGIVQRDHGRQRHLDLRHAAAVRHGRGGKARRAENSRRQRPPPRAVQGGARHPAARSRPSGGQGRRGRAQIRRDHGGRRGLRTRRRRRSRCRSPIRRWSRPRSRARTPIGAASSPPSARPAKRPTATGSPSGSATFASRPKASAIRAMTKPKSHS